MIKEDKNGKVHKIFMKAYNNSYNFFSFRVEYFEGKNYYFELSKNKFMDIFFWGVTVITKDGEKRKNLNATFDTKEEALEYINKIEKEV